MKHIMKKIIILSSLLALGVYGGVCANAQAAVSNFEFQNQYNQTLPSTNGVQLYSGERAVRAAAHIDNADGADTSAALTLEYWKDGALISTEEQTCAVPANGGADIATDCMVIEKSADVNIAKCILKARITVDGETTAIETLGKGQFDITEAMAPIFRSKTMYNESVLMIEPEEGGLPEAVLMYEPTEIISVKNAQLNYEFKEGIDWVYEDGKLKLLDGENRADRLTYLDWYPKKGTIGQEVWKTKDGRLTLHDEAIWQRQLAVTYRHNARWDGPSYSFHDEKLPLTKAKLSNNEDVAIVLSGDSISAGSNASRGNPPYMPSWGELSARTLRNNYFSKITFNNTAVGGMSSSWGVQQVQNNILQYNPDLTIIAFGMNDAIGVAKEGFKNNIKAMMDAVRANNENAEFILVAPMLGNLELEYFTAPERFDEYKAALNELAEGDIHTAVLDITTTHQTIMNMDRKRYIDMSGSNVNHPNDFLVRIYAQQLCSMLIN